MGKSYLNKFFMCVDVYDIIMLKRKRKILNCTSAYDALKIIFGAFMVMFMM